MTSNNQHRTWEAVSRKPFFLFREICLFIVATLLLCSLWTCGNNEALYPELWAAASGGKFEKVKQLVEKGLDVNKKDASGSTAIIHASTGGHTDVVKYLISKKADVNVKENSIGLTALSAAASGGHAATVLLLLNAGATDIPGAYMYAEQYHRQDIMEMLKAATR